MPNPDNIYDLTKLETWPKEYNKYIITDQEEIKKRAKISEELKSVATQEIKADPVRAYLNSTGNGSLAERYYAIAEKFKSKKYEPTDEEKNEYADTILQMIAQVSDIKASDLLNVSDEDIKKDYVKYSYIYKLNSIVDDFFGRGIMVENTADLYKIYDLSKFASLIEFRTNIITTPYYQYVDHYRMIAEQPAEDLKMTIDSLKESVDKDHSLNGYIDNLNNWIKSAKIKIMAMAEYISDTRQFKKSAGVSYSVGTGSKIVDHKRIQEFTAEDWDNINKGTVCTIQYGKAKINIKLNADETISYEYPLDSIEKQFKDLAAIYPEIKNKNTKKPNGDLIDYTSAADQEYIRQGNPVLVTINNITLEFYMDNNDLGLLKCRMTDKSFATEFTNGLNTKIQSSNDRTMVFFDNYEPIDLNNREHIDKIESGKKILVMQEGRQYEVSTKFDAGSPVFRKIKVEAVSITDTYTSELNNHEMTIENMKEDFYKRFNRFDEVLQSVIDADPGYIKSHQPYKNLRAAVEEYSQLLEKERGNVESEDYRKEMISKAKNLQTLAEAYRDSKDGLTLSKWGTKRMDAVMDVYRYATDQIYTLDALDIAQTMKNEAIEDGKANLHKKIEEFKKKSENKAKEIKAVDNAKVADKANAVDNAKVADKPKAEKKVEPRLQPINIAKSAQPKLIERIKQFKSEYDKNDYLPKWIKIQLSQLLGEDTTDMNFWRGADVRDTTEKIIGTMVIAEILKNEHEKGAVIHPTVIEKAFDENGNVVSSIGKIALIDGLKTGRGMKYASGSEIKINHIRNFLDVFVPSKSAEKFAPDMIFYTLCASCDEMSKKEELPSTIKNHLISKETQFKLAYEDKNNKDTIGIIASDIAGAMVAARMFELKPELKPQIEQLGLVELGIIGQKVLPDTGTNYRILDEFLDKIADNDYINDIALPNEDEITLELGSYAQKVSMPTIKDQIAVHIDNLYSEDDAMQQIAKQSLTGIKNTMENILKEREQIAKNKKTDIGEFERKMQNPDECRKMIEKLGDKKMLDTSKKSEAPAMGK